MGRTKMYTDPETGNSQQGFRSTSSNNNTSQNLKFKDPKPPEQDRGQNQKTTQNQQSQNQRLPDRMVLRNPESLPLKVLCRLMVMRFKRSWISFRFQANRYSLGLLGSKFTYQILAIGLLGWYVLSDWQYKANLGAPLGSDRPANVIGAAIEMKGGETKPNNWKSTNEAAPVSASELYKEQVDDYIQRFGQIARTEMEKYGIPASISLAQGLIESRAGLSKLAVRNNNHFGIKCFSRSCGKGHCSNFTDDTHKDFFRKFQSPWDSWREHSKLLSSGRYRKLQQHGRDYRQWAYGLKSVGYATDRTYAEKLIGMIERYDLHRFDK